MWLPVLTKIIPQKMIDTTNLNMRFTALRMWLLDRGVRNYMSVFRACDPLITDDDEEEIRSWWASRSPLVEEDAELLTRLENIVEHLKTATL